LVASVSATSPERIQLRPLGEIDLCENAVGAHLAISRARGNRLYLGYRGGTSLRLPSAEYQLLVNRGASWSTHLCRVSAGRRKTLAPHRAALSIPLPPEFEGGVYLDGWSDVALSGAGGHLGIDSEGPVLAWIFHQQDQGRTLERLWLEGTDNSFEAPPTVPWEPVRVLGPEGPVAGARIYAIDSRDRGPTLVATSTTDRQGRGSRAPRETRRNIVFHAPGLAWMTTHPHDFEDTETVQLQRGFGLEVQIRGEESDLRDLVVTIRLEHEPLLTFTEHCDRRGRVRFSDLPRGNATVSLTGRDYLPQQAEISIPTDGPRFLDAVRGASIEGLVRDPDGHAAGGVFVGLRDTSGSTREDKTTRTDSAGRFAFHGLRDENVYTLFARRQSGGKTWSTQVRGVQPDGSECVLDLRREDPIPPHQRHRAK